MRCRLFLLFNLFLFGGCHHQVVKRYEEIYTKDLEGLGGVDVVFVDSLRGVCGGMIWNEGAFCFTTRDGGKSWSSKTFLGKRGLINKLIHKEGRVYVHLKQMQSDSSEVLVSDDLGETWQHLFGAPLLIDVYVQDSLNLFRVRRDSSRGKEFWQHSRDGGRTWQLNPLFESPSWRWRFGSETLIYRHEGARGKYTRLFTRNVKTGEEYRYLFPEGYEGTGVVYENFTILYRNDTLELFRLERGRLVRYGSFGAEKREHVKYFFHDGKRFCIATFQAHNMVFSSGILYMSDDGAKTWQRETPSYYPLKIAVDARPEGMKVWLFSKRGRYQLFGVYVY